MAAAASASMSVGLDANDQLREMFPPGATVHTILRHVSKSGDVSRVGVVAITGPDLLVVDRLVAEAVGLRSSKGGIVVRGLSVNVSEFLVMELSRALYSDYYQLRSQPL